MPPLSEPTPRRRHAVSDGELLIDYARTGSHAAFGELVARHGAGVLRRCRRVLANEHDAEDACQAAFQLLHRKASSLSDPEALGGWLKGAAFRIATAMRRSDARRDRLGPMAARSEADEVGGEEDRRELVRVLMVEVERLPREYQEAIRLCYLEGLSHPEAAGKLGWPVGTLKIRLTRARAILRERPACRRLFA